MSKKAIPTAFDWKSLYLPAAFLALYFTAIVFRPLLPIDETRYLTAAWEMYLRHDWFAPLTVNFQPYHHKPPLLFWLVNLSWTVFGVSRWAATIPVVLASMTSVILLGALCKRLVPDLQLRAQLTLLGMFSFLIYSTAILFDLTLTVFVLAALLTLLAYAKSRRKKYVALLGLWLGLGVLTKGPVAYLYVLFPVLLGPYWAEDSRHRSSWYLGALAALVLSFIPVLAWLIPVLKSSSNEFGYWLVWEQTAGRITGSYASSHDRPVYFYLLVLPVMCLPWLLFPRFWTQLRELRTGFNDHRGIRFLVTWFVPTFIAFSLIGGKQPHYMTPLLPGVAILFAYLLRGLSTRTVQVTAALMLVLFIGGHYAMSKTVMSRYDLRPVAAYVAEHRDRDWAYYNRYRGEFTFMARLQKPVESITSLEALAAWFDAHPDGLAVVRFMHPEEVERYDRLYQMEYRAKHLGIFARRPDDDAPAEP
jgi:4-amino-4-deoxy-L-arabinose transferase-like glycosyltransferase